MEVSNLLVFFKWLAILSFVRIEASLTDVKNVTKFIEAMPKVELHLHLDGAMRPSTLWELAQRKGFPTLPDSVKNSDEFASFLQMRDNGNLPEFLRKFDFMLPQISGDADALRRVARELCETKAREGVVYFEARYAPQLLTTPGDGGGKSLSLNQVVEAVNDGLKEGSAAFNVTAKSILSCMRIPGGSRWSMALARLALRHRNNGVVGIDLAGDESVVDAAHPDDAAHVDAFDFAFRHGVHRTVHAGEAGPAWNVGEAIGRLHAERIGHGYRVLENDAVYALVKARGIHLEECPYSSVKTGAFDLARFGWWRHPVRRFYEDGVSFSVNTDDPTVTGHALVDDLSVVVVAPPGGVGLPMEALVKSLYYAIDASFAEKEEKMKVRKRINEMLREMLREI